RFLRPFEGLVTAAAVFQQGVGDQMGQGAELQIPLVAASALSRPEIFQPGIVHREVQQSPHRVGQGELLQHRCRKNVAVHNSKHSWVNSRRCQIGTYDTDFVSAAKRQHPELTGYNTYKPEVDDDSVDFGIAAKGPFTTVHSPRLEMQLKCTSMNEIDDVNIRFPLKLKNYDDLRNELVMIPRLLVVVVVPESVDDWIEHEEEGLTL